MLIFLAVTHATLLAEEKSLDLWGGKMLFSNSSFLHLSALVLLIFLPPLSVLACITPISSSCPFTFFLARKVSVCVWVCGEKNFFPVKNTEPRLSKLSPQQLVKVFSISTFFGEGTNVGGESLTWIYLDIPCTKY